MLIEVMVGAIVLAIATLAVLDGIDGAQRIGATNKNRSVQSTLAQQDIERMRSMPISALNNLNDTRTVTVAGVDYTVVSTTTWVSDESGLVTCSDNQAQAEYLKLSSTVTSPATTLRPVTETGLRTPNVGQLADTRGVATVKLTDRNDSPLAGVTVAMTGPSAQSATTNALGCAVFGYVPSGSYTVTVIGYVETKSVNPATATLVVYPGRGSFGQMQVDRPALLRANFIPPLGQTFTTSMVWDKITVKNAKLPGAAKIFTRAGRATSVDAPDLFPFTDGVGVYAGNCAANDPSAYLTNYFVPGGRGFTALDPGDNPRNVNVEMPTLRVNVTRQPTGSPSAVPTWTRTQLLVTALDGGCTATHQLQPADRSASATTVSFDIAVPFGRYRVCGYTRGRTSASDSTVIDRRYTTGPAAGTSPANPADQNLTTIPPTPDRQITITTPSASSAASNGTCF